MVNAYKSVDDKKVEELVSLLRSCQLENRTVFLCGNGGSASTSNHAAVDLGIGSHIRGVRINTVALTCNSSILTAIANDLEFREIFSRQIHLHGSEGDVLIVISASGNSENLVCAIEAAKQLKMSTVALLGFDGGKIKQMANLVLHANTKIGEYGLVEDIHLSLIHYITERIRKEFIVVE